MMSERNRWVSLLAVGALCVGFVGSVGFGGFGVVSASAATAWKVAATANPAGADISGFSAVSCASGRACAAVGSYTANLSSPDFPLAEMWNGTSWRMRSVPILKGTASTDLYGVSCPSITACTAVGSAFYNKGSRTVTFAAAWNGKTWRIQATPNSATTSRRSFYAVSCTSSRACTAVGIFTTAGESHALIERWNGKTWQVQKAAQPKGQAWLSGVSCSSANACTAVGYQQDSVTTPLIEAWNGRSWTVQNVPLPHGVTSGILSAVSCTAANACTATGTDFAAAPYGPTLAERWNGKSWHVQSTPAPKNYQSSMGSVRLEAVSCASARACTATGVYSPGGLANYFIESWNGSKWRMMSAPRPAGFQHGALLGISCKSPRCVAAGAYTGSKRLQVTLALAN